MPQAGMNPAGSVSRDLSELLAGSPSFGSPLALLVLPGRVANASRKCSLVSRGVRVRGRCWEALHKQTEQSHK